MHPTIAYQLVQEHMADLHRQARGETLILASTGAGAKQVPARRAQVAGPGRPEPQSATCRTLAKLETLVKPLHSLRRLVRSLVRLAALSRKRSRPRSVTHAYSGLSSDASAVSRGEAPGTPSFHPSTSGSGIPLRPAHGADHPNGRTRSDQTAHRRSSG